MCKYFHFNLVPPQIWNHFRQRLALVAGMVLIISSSPIEAKALTISDLYNAAEKALAIVHPSSADTTTAGMSNS